MVNNLNNLFVGVDDVKRVFERKRVMISIIEDKVDFFKNFKLI